MSANTAMHFLIISTLSFPLFFVFQRITPGEIGRLLALMHELDHNGLSSLLDPLRKGRLARE
jgi:uncharacterized protein (DUF3820 family)